MVNTEILQAIQKECAEYNASLIAVSKNRPTADILALYDQGQRDFGENRVQELLPKSGVLPGDINWHLIGHLQKNKAKSVIPVATLIHSADSIALIELLDEWAVQSGRTIKILLQMHIAREENKYGFSGSEILQWLDEGGPALLKAVRICGLMGMATFTEDQNQIRKEFRQLRAFFDRVKREFWPDNKDFGVLSMGMSGDYKLALAEGSTMIRVGSALFS